MRKNIIVSINILFGIFITSCDNEVSVSRGDNGSFIKIFGSEHIEFAEDMILHEDDEITLLVTQKIAANQDSFKIKVIHTDKLGNINWKTVFPTNSDEFVGKNFKANSIILENNDYLIVGESINDKGLSSILILRMDSNGNINNRYEHSLINNVSIRGIDIISSNTGNYYVSASVDSIGHEIWIGKFEKNLETVNCFKFYPSGSNNSKTLQSIDINEEETEIVFGLSGTINDKNIGQFVKIPTCGSLILGSTKISSISSNRNFEANHMIKMKNGYAFIGTTNINGNDDIFVMKIDNDGNFIDSNPILYNTLENINFQNNENGLIIYQTSDGGFLLGGSTISNENQSKDVIIIKTNYNGNVEWYNIYGDENDDEANAVIETKNGGVLIYATTNFAGSNSLMIIKTDRYGNVY